MRPYSPPKRIGPHAIRFIAVLREGEQHQDLDLPIVDFARLATWVDASGVYYGSYWERCLLEYRDHPNFRPVPTFSRALSTVCPLPVDKPRGDKLEVNRQPVARASLRAALLPLRRVVPDKICTESELGV